MPKFYFDLSTEIDTFLDDEGCEVLNVTLAKRLALELLGQKIIDQSEGGVLGRIAVDVRDDKGPVLRVSAVVEEIGSNRL